MDNNLEKAVSKIDSVFSNTFGLADNPEKLFPDGLDAGEKRLKILFHPDKYQDQTDILLASNLTKIVSGLVDLIKNKKRVDKYTIYDTISVGDASSIFFASSGDKNFVIKAATPATTDKYLQEEYNTIFDIHTKTDGLVYQKLFRTPVEVVKDGGTNYYVYNYRNLVSLKKLLDILGTIDGRHIAWIYKRILLALNTMHTFGYAHTAVTPDHILIDKADHGINLIGQLHSVKADQKIKFVSAKYKDWYPADAKNLAATTSLDILLATKSILENNDTSLLNKKLLNFLLGVKHECLVNIKAGNNIDTSALYSEWTDLLKRVYGQPKWVDLVL